NEDALYGRALAFKGEGNLPEAMKAFQHYVSLPHAARSKEAQTQIAQIDLRLKNQAPVAKAEPQKRDVKGGADLSALPVGKDEEGAVGAPPLPELPSDDPEGVAPTQAAQPAPEGEKKDEPKKDEPAAKDKGQTGGSTGPEAKVQASR